VVALAAAVAVAVAVAVVVALAAVTAVVVLIVILVVVVLMVPVLVPWRRVAVGSGAEVGRVRVLVCEADARGLRVASYGLEGGV
jgi:hypothetical protein